MEEDEDAFLYGESTVEPEPIVHVTAPVLVETVNIPIPNDKIANGVAEASEEALIPRNKEVEADEDAEEDEREEDEDEDDDESDVEIILDTPVPARSRDFRAVPASRGSISKTFHSTPRPPVHLTTEYTPRERGAPVAKTSAQQLVPEPTAIPKSTEPVSETYPTPNIEQQPNTAPTSLQPDPSSLPPVRASASAPPIDPSEAGEFSGMPVYDVDMQSLADKAWRRPGSDISDWFNYGFDEISWEAYCARRREMTTVGSDLKANVMNLAGMSEEMLQNSVPPELRSMLIAQSARMGLQQQQQQQQMNFHPQFGGPPPQGGFPMQMMHPGMGMAPDMMGVGMPPQMGMSGPGMGMGVGPGMPDGSGTPMHNNIMGAPGGINSVQGQTPQTGEDAAAIQQSQGPHGSEGGFPMQMGHFSPQSMGMNQGVGGDFSNTGSGVQNMGSGMQDSMVGPSPIPSYTESTTPGHAGGSTSMRGRGRGIPSRPFGGGVPLGPASARTGTGTPIGMGRGQFTNTGPPQMLPKRPASPLPPNVPTGPRNQMPRYKDKDRDGGSTQLDGLDYGGNGGGSGSGSGAEDRERDPHKERHRERDPDRDRDKGKDRERDRDRERESERDKEKERPKDRDSEREKHREDVSRKKEKTPPTGPRKDLEKEERERRSRDERRSSRDERRRDSDDKSSSRKRPHSEDHERESRSSKRR